MATTLKPFNQQFWLARQLPFWCVFSPTQTEVPISAHSSLGRKAVGVLLWDVTEGAQQLPQESGERVWGQALLSTVSNDSLLSYSKLLCLCPWVTWEAWPFEAPENVANCNIHPQLASLRMTSNKLGLEIPKVRCQFCPLETHPVEEQL